MTNVEALAVIAELISDFNQSVGSRSESELKALIHDRIIGLSLSRQTAPVAELIAKAWVEHSPSSVEARATAVAQLYVVGRPEEAARLEDGEPPDPVDETSEENVAWSRKNAERSADF